LTGYHNFGGFNVK